MDDTRKILRQPTTQFCNMGITKDVISELVFRPLRVVTFETESIIRENVPLHYGAFATVKGLAETVEKNRWRRNPTQNLDSVP